jgi:hypothetical protein
MVAMETMSKAERRRWILATSLYLGERSHARIVRSQELIAESQRTGDASAPARMQKPSHN